MLSTGFAKICYFIAVLPVLLKWHLVLSSSIYAGRHEAINITEQGPSAASDGKLYIDAYTDIYKMRRISGFRFKQVRVLSTGHREVNFDCNFCQSKTMNER